MKIKPTALEPWHLDAAGLTLCVVLSLVAYLGGYQPLRQSYEECVVEGEALSAQQEQAAKLENALAILRRRLDAARETLAANALPLKPASTVNLHVAAVSALAVQSGLRIDDVQTGSVSENAYYEAVPIHVAGGGTYPACTAFLRRLRKAFPDTGVSSLELAGHKTDPLEPGTFRVALNWYTAPRPGAAVKQASELTHEP